MSIGSEVLLWKEHFRQPYIVENCGEDFFPYFEVTIVSLNKVAALPILSYLDFLAVRQRRQICIPVGNTTWQGLGWYEHYKDRGAPLEFEKEEKRINATNDS